LVIAAIFGTNHNQPNFLGLRLLLLYRFLSSSFSFLLFDTVFLRTTLRTVKILSLFHYCFRGETIPVNSEWSRKERREQQKTENGGAQQQK